MQLTKTLLHTTDTYIKKLFEVGIHTTDDFLWLFPRTYEDKSDVNTTFSHLNIQEKQVVQCSIEILTEEKTRNKKLLTKAVLTDSQWFHSEAVWFNRRMIANQFHSGDEVLIFGKPKYEYGKLSFSSPEIEHVQENRREILPVYSDVNYIPGTWIRDKMSFLRIFIREQTTSLPQNIQTKKWFRPYTENIEALHFPKDIADFTRATEELWYEELFRFQYQGLKKKYDLEAASSGNSPQIPLDTDFIKSILGHIPYPLTNKQKIVLFQILKDMERPHAMARLLQWDVGTGKTIVAMIAAIHAIRQNDIQVAIMAPTEILARQHFLWNLEFLEWFNIKSDLLVWSLTPKQKKEAVERLKSGGTNIIFGTHALIQDHVQFHRLGFVVVDEQHRFWVEQRKALEEYCSQRSPENTIGILPHRLNMSATPIPRTLALTLYWDQDISVLDEYPVGRKPIHTRVIREDQRNEVYRFIEEEVSQWRQVYWISPLVEESENLDIASAVNMQEILMSVFPDRTVGLIHGKMSGKEKDRIMQDFYNNTIQILSSTSVVEVWVNNPNATIICIEASERFWLSQLHQFRGRVGRWNDQSYCYLFTTKEYKNDRLKAMEQTTDGFELAEIDLELRGPWEVYGVRQSWVPDLRFASLTDTNLISEIRNDIEDWIRSK